MANVSRCNPNRRWASCSVVLAGNVGIRAVHAAQLGADRSTDVISFAYPPEATVAGWHGEVIVNRDRARVAGMRHEGRAAELALYIAHGCHHLSGADDATPALRRAMRRTERVWLQQADRDGLVSPLWPEPL